MCLQSCFHRLVYLQVGEVIWCNCSTKCLCWLALCRSPRGMSEHNISGFKTNDRRLFPVGSTGSRVLPGIQSPSLRPEIHSTANVSFIIHSVLCVHTRNHLSDVAIIASRFAKKRIRHLGRSGNAAYFCESSWKPCGSAHLLLLRLSVQPSWRNVCIYVLCSHLLPGAKGETGDSSQIKPSDTDTRNCQQAVLVHSQQSDAREGLPL